MKTTRSLLTTLCLSLTLFGCFLKQDRTTVVYGTITDEKGLPVDSIMVLADGIHLLSNDSIASTYSDENGTYEILIKVPKKFSSVNVGIPGLQRYNAKFLKLFKTYDVVKDGVKAGNCCISDIGKKTRHDFRLNFK